MTLCHRCGHRRYPGRGRLHDTGLCTQPWYQRVRAKHPGRPGRPADWDYTPEQIERIMQRRAREQRYERAMSGGQV